MTISLRFTVTSMRRARVLARAATEAAFRGGFTANAAQYTLSDLGLLSLTEMCDIDCRIKQACPEKPLVVVRDGVFGGSAERAAHRGGLCQRCPYGLSHRRPRGAKALRTS